jgi:hypothetical protein
MRSWNGIAKMGSAMSGAGAFAKKSSTLINPPSSRIPPEDKTKHDNTTFGVLGGNSRTGSIVVAACISIIKD